MLNGVLTIFQGADIEQKGALSDPERRGPAFLFQFKPVGSSEKGWRMMS